MYQSTLGSTLGNLKLQQGQRESGLRREQGQATAARWGNMASIGQVPLQLLAQYEAQQDRLDRRDYMKSQSEYMQGLRETNDIARDIAGEDRDRKNMYSEIRGRYITEDGEFDYDGILEETGASGDSNLHLLAVGERDNAAIARLSQETAELERYGAIAKEMAGDIENIMHSENPAAVWTAVGKDINARLIQYGQQPLPEKYDEDIFAEMVLRGTDVADRAAVRSQLNAVVGGTGSVLLPTDARSRPAAFNAQLQTLRDTLAPATNQEELNQRWAALHNQLDPEVLRFAQQQGLRVFPSADDGGQRKFRNNLNVRHPGAGGATTGGFLDYLKIVARERGHENVDDFLADASSDDLISLRTGWGAAIQQQGQDPDTFTPTTNSGVNQALRFGDDKREQLREMEARVDSEGNRVYDISRAQAADRLDQIQEVERDMLQVISREDEPLLIEALQGILNEQGYADTLDNMITFLQNSDNRRALQDQSPAFANIDLLQTAEWFQRHGLTSDQQQPPAEPWRFPMVYPNNNPWGR